ncbi:alkene reductase [Nocardia sp. NPDC050378]|uniref:alkene reductase n=1 Tax=Nocardia sp. NPDC050378 TaxID=3155400 RepID=UPI00340F3C81
MNTLFEPLDLGALTTPNRIFFSPCSRYRARLDEVPSPMMEEYYRQRASAGLIITEGVNPDPMGRGYLFTPALYSQEQEDGWRPITSGVRDAGGSMFAQLMHVGRMTWNSLLPGGATPVAPSEVRPDPEFRGYAVNASSPKNHFHPTPEALTADGIASTIEGFVNATRRALDAGFAGVEIHAASGYLPMQFLSSSTNRRIDRYGGSVPNRCLFLLELIDAVSAVGGAERVAVKFSPGFRFNDIHDDDPVELYTHLLRQLSGARLAFVEVADFGGYYGYEPPTNWFELARNHYRGKLVANGGLTYETGSALVADGTADAVSYGALFLANPDLPERFRLGAGLNVPDASTFYTQGTVGYLDYPTLNDGPVPMPSEVYAGHASFSSPTG